MQPRASALLAISLGYLLYSEPWANIVYYLLWWLRLTTGWAIGALILFAVSFQRHDLGTLVIPVFAMAWVFAPDWMRWWLEPQESVVALVLLGCIFALVFYKFIPTMTCILMPGMLMYWSHYGWSLEGFWVLLSSGWLSTHLPGLVVLVMEGLCQLVSCVGCVVAGCMLITSAVFRTLNNARRPERGHSEGTMDFFRPVLAGIGTGILASVAHSDTLEALLTAVVCLTPVFATCLLYFTSYLGTPLPLPYRLCCFPVACTMIGWWWVDWLSLLQFIYAAGAFAAVVVGLIGDALVIALWRTDHREKWRALRLMLGCWAGLIWGGYWPSMVEVIRCTCMFTAELWHAWHWPGATAAVDMAHQLAMVSIIPILLVSYVSWRIHRMLTRKFEQTMSAIVLDMDFRRVTGGTVEMEEASPLLKPSESQRKRIQDIREDLPNYIRVWKAATASKFDSLRHRGIGPWILWELLEAKSVGDIVLIVNELVRCDAKTVQHPVPAVLLHVDRNHLYKNGLHLLSKLQPPDLEARVIKVTFDGELGQDYGGLRREFFTQFALCLAQTSQPGALFTTAQDNTLIPRPVTAGQKLPGLRPYYVVGRFLGLAIMQQHPIPTFLNRITYKLMVGRPVTICDVKAVDPEFFHNRFEVLLQPNGVALMEEWLCGPLMFMSAETELQPVPVPLREGGANERVTEDNKHDYLQLLAHHYVLGGIEAQLKAMLQGFHEVVPLEVLTHLQLGPKDMELLLTGVRVLDIGDWKAHTQVDADTPAKQQVVQWFWHCVDEMDAEHHSRLLAFVTGCTRLPAEGFSALRFNLLFDANSDHLPSAHTCSHTLVLPLCNSQKDLTSKLNLVLCDVASLGFGLA